jgi:hypothetical protein
MYSPKNLAKELGEWKPIVLGLGALYIAYKLFWRPISSIGETVASYTAGIQQAASIKTDKAKSTSLAGATDTDIINFREDASAVAMSLGTHPSSSWYQSGSEDELGAWTVLKKYTRYLWRDGKTIAKRAVKYQIESLEPFYKDVTNGRSLKADCFKYMTEGEYPSLLKRVW